MQSADRQTLVFDADDTLWENNILFERAFQSFHEWRFESMIELRSLRSLFDEIEQVRIQTHGYGYETFRHSLTELFERMLNRHATLEEAEEIDYQCASILTSHVELIAGVSETLTELRDRHDLMLLTKGNPEEQQRKLASSGLSHHFGTVSIVAEKNVATYQAFLHARGLVPDRTWMIGNSPRSDILPACAAGMRTVLIPHPHTWHLELETIPVDVGVLQLERLSELTHYF